jgi:uncharacterized protein
MILFNFTIGNYRSIAGKKTLSLEPAIITDFPQNVIQKSNYKWLSSTVIYGANASGKSNLLHAMSIMKRIVVESFDKRSVNELPYDPFLLSTTTPQEPTFYEIEFLVENIKYRYGFEADKYKIQTEWLFQTKKKSEKPLFRRVADGIEVMPIYAEGKDLEEKTRDNALFLSVVDQFNGRIAGQIMQWFRHFNTISGLSHDNYRAVTFSMLNNPVSNALLAHYFKQIDVGFDKIKIEKKLFDSKELPTDLSDDLIKQLMSDLEGKTMVQLHTLHPIYDPNQHLIKEIEFDARRQESAGANKMIDLSGILFNTLQEGGVLIVDELDAKLHPLLTLSIVKLFQNQDINQTGAQLIFATHDTNLLSICELRRDQIYFVEKDRFGATDLYSLVEYNQAGKIRKDRSFEKDYINGRYGAIPYFGNLNQFLEQWREK